MTATELQSALTRLFGAHHGALGEAAAALGVSRRSLEGYRDGSRAVPQTLERLIRLLLWLPEDQRQAWLEKE